VTFEYKVPMRRNRKLPVFGSEEPSEPAGRAPRVARLVALAHKLEAMVRSGLVKDHGEVARRARVSPARVAQIVILSQLAPDIQEYVLFLSSEHAGLITELQLRGIARELRWDRQRDALRALLAQPS
jgi:hypothetical protein